MWPWLVVIGAWLIFALVVGSWADLDWLFGIGLVGLVVVGFIGLVAVSIWFLRANQAWFFIPQ